MDPDTYKGKPEVESHLGKLALTQGTNLNEPYRCVPTKVRPGSTLI